MTSAPEPGKDRVQLELITSQEEATTQLSAFEVVQRCYDCQTMPYPEYLQTPEWAQRRQMALHAAGFRCQLNARHWHDLEAHHRDYARRGAELPKDLTILCAECHEHVHKYIMGDPTTEAAA